MALTVDNFGSGLLVDEELMAGVTEESGSFVAFVLRHTTGEYLGYRPYPRLEDALSAINAIPRPWQFEASGGCGTGNCGSKNGSGGGDCAKCQVRACGTELCPQNS